MLSCCFTDQVFVCISPGFKCPCAKKHSRSDSFLLSIWYSFGKRTILVLSYVHFVQGGNYWETSPGATSVITKCLNFVPWKPIKTDFAVSPLSMRSYSIQLTQFYVIKMLQMKLCFDSSVVISRICLQCSGLGSCTEKNIEHLELFVLN